MFSFQFIIGVYMEINAISSRHNLISESNQWGHCNNSMIVTGFVGFSNIFTLGHFRKVTLGALCSWQHAVIFQKL